MVVHRLSNVTARDELMSAVKSVITSKQVWKKIYLFIYFSN